VAGKVTTVRAELVDLTGDLEILTTAGATILLDGKPAGEADGGGTLLLQGLNQPQYKIRVAKAGYNPEEQEVNLAIGIVSSVTIDLKPIEVVPENAPAGAPDYALQRRLVFSESPSVSHVFFQPNSLHLVSFGGEEGTTTLPSGTQAPGVC
jgi:hypothetical protein